MPWTLQRPGHLKKNVELKLRGDKDMTKKEQYQQKRQRLAQLTAHFRQIRQSRIDTAKTVEDAFYWASRTLNSFIVELYQEQAGEGEFKTFGQWKRENRTIKKGEQGWPIWGQPLGTREDDKPEEKEDENLYFPLCYLFHESQTVAPEQVSKPQRERAKAEILEVI